MRLAKTKLVSNSLMIIVALTIVISGCKKDNKPASVSYPLKTTDLLGVSGTVTFTETSSTVTTVTISLTGSDAMSHPAYIYNNSAVQGGATAIMLTPVVNGSSTTTVTQLNNSTPITYDQMTAFNGYLNVEESSTDTSEIIAQGDIGGNALTGKSKSYTLSTVGSLGVSGTALLQQRNNDNTLITLSLTGTLANNFYPAGLYLGSVSTVGGGPLEVTLQPVVGASGKSSTNVSGLNNSTPITYDNLLVYDGYIAVTEAAPDTTTILCEGNIGSH